MFDPLRRLVLRVARVPAAPQPPFGAPDSIRVFRAGRNHYRLKVVGWAFAQAVTLVGILFSLQFLHHLREDLRDPAAAHAPQVGPGTSGHDAVLQVPQQASRHAARQVSEHAPRWLLPVLVVGEALGVLVYLLQLPLTFAALRLDYELRWYMVTDRSLRIRSGIMTIRESTMSFANLQQVEVTQGPLQRLLGLADVRVQSAGGGGGRGDNPGKGHQQESLHTGVFQGVEQAAEIRDLILDRLRQFRAAGLGDPDDHGEAAGAIFPPALPCGEGEPTLSAARVLLAEARALRQALRAAPGGGSGR